MSGDSKRQWGQLGAYLLIVVMAMVGFYEMGKVDDKFCQSGQENREAIRNLTIAISALGQDLIRDDQPLNELDAEDREALRAFRTFEADQVALLEPPVC